MQRSDTRAHCQNPLNRLRWKEMKIPRYSCFEIALPYELLIISQLTLSSRQPRLFAKGINDIQDTIQERWQLFRQSAIAVETKPIRRLFVLSSGRSSRRKSPWYSRWQRSREEFNPLDVVQSRRNEERMNGARSREARAAHY